MRDGFVSPMPFRAQYDYSHDAILRSCEDSLQRLGLAHIDIVYVHDIGALTHGADDGRHWQALTAGGGLRALARLREERVIGAFGVGVNEVAVCERAMAETRLDVILLAGRYTLLDQSALDGLLPACLAQQTSIVIGGPYNSGILATGTRGWGDALRLRASECSHDRTSRGDRDHRTRLRRDPACGGARLRAGAPGGGQRDPRNGQCASGDPDLGTPCCPDPDSILDSAARGRVDPPRRACPWRDTMTIDAIRLSPDDNVVVTCRAVDQGTTILVDGVALTLAQTVPIGHKLAFTAIGAGARVIKYGMPIGSMTEAVQPGDWVHMHNMQSDYMPAHLRDATGGTAGEPA
jgi:hypothetical protein